MNAPAGSIARIALRTGIAIAVAFSALPVSTHPAHAQAQPTPSRKMNGFEVSGRFLEVWSKQGTERDSLYVNGLPITERRQQASLEDGKLYDTQWFERARYELHPSNKAPNDVLLGRLGASRVEGRGKVDPATGKAVSPADAAFVGVDKPTDLVEGKLWFPETRHTLTGKLLEAWRQYGGLAQFGFPLSEPHQEVSQADGKPYTVQYFERNRMELHPEKPAPYNVELGLLGVEQVGMRAVPGDELPVAPTKGATTTKDSMVIFSTYEPANLGVFETTQIALRLRSLVEDGLVGRDDNDNLFPLDAWYVPTLENGGAVFVGEGEDRYLRVKYKIRQGIKWNDGAELTSNDAIFAYKLALNPDVAAPNRAEYVRLQNVDNPDKYTVIYNYRSLNQAKAYYGAIPDKENYSYIRNYIDAKKPVTSRAYSAMGTIYPEHVLGKVPPAQIKSHPASSTPVGTGPYRVQIWNKKQEMVLVPNEYYSQTAKPLIKTLRIKFGSYLPDAQVKTGEVDMVPSEAFNAPPADRRGLEGTGYKIATRPAATWEHLDFQFGYAPFKEKAVREAIIRAINRQRISDVVYYGTAGVMNSVVPPGVYFSLDNPSLAKNYLDIAAKYKLPIYSYNPEHAKQLLDAAGWLPGPDGIRTKGGIKLSFEYATTTQAVPQQIQSLVSADLKAVGIDARPKDYPSSVFFSGDDRDPRVTGVCKLCQFAYVTTRESDFSEWNCYYSWDRSVNPFPTYPGYCNRDLDVANSRFNSELDPRAQLEAAAQAQYILMQDIVTIPLVLRPNIEIVRNTLANYKLTNTTTSSFWNARQWYFK